MNILKVFLVFSFLAFLPASDLIATPHPDISVKHRESWEGFEFKYGKFLDKKRKIKAPEFYELTKDYTMRLSPYDASGWGLARYYLPPQEWDFIKLHGDDFLTIKKGYRWDGATRPCKDDRWKCFEKNYHYRGTVLHDSLYDLMRMGYLEPDTNHHEKVGDCALDKHSDNNTGDKNRAIADYTFKDLVVEDGQGTGAAWFDVGLIQDCGAYNTHDDSLLAGWKFHVSELTAYVGFYGDSVEMRWKSADSSGKDINYKNFEPNNGYEIYRNGEIVGEVPAYRTYWEDITDELVLGEQYSYQIRPKSGNANMDDYSNIDTVTYVHAPGNSLKIGYEYTDLDAVQYVKSDTVFYDIKNLHFLFSPDAITLEAWVYPEEQLHSNASIMTFRSGPEGSDNVFDLTYCGPFSKERFCVSSFSWGGQNSQVVTSEDIFPPHNWYHVAVTLEKEEVEEYVYEYVGTLFINGMQQTSFNIHNTTALTDSQNSDEGRKEFSIGGGRYNHGDIGKQFIGMIDEARVWEKPRTQDEIQLYMCQSPWVSQPGMVGVWHFDEPPETAVPTEAFCDEWGIASKSNLEDSLDGNTSSTPFFPGCKSFDETPNANDGVLIRKFPLPFDGYPFAPSGAMQPKIEASDRIIPIYLDATGNASISAEQLAAESMNTYCFESMSVEPNHFSCQDTGEQVVELSAIDLYGNMSNANAFVAVIDAIAPEIESSVSETMIPPDVPISFVASATDNCGVSSFEVANFDCYKYTKKGKRITKTQGCRVELSGDQVTISGSAGVDTHISWTLVAIDDSGNMTEEIYETLVVNPGKKK